MASKNLSAGAPPIFISKNYVNSDANTASDILASTGQSFATRIYDMDAGSYWVSVGSNDSTTETVTIGLYEGSDQTSRSIDFVALIGLNFKRFKVEYSNDNGSNYTIFTGLDYTGSDFAGTNKIVSLDSAVSANKIKITITTTQTVNAEKQLTEFVVGLATFQPTYAMSGYSKGYNQNRRDVKMGDGTIDYTYIMRGPTSFEMYEADITFNFVSTADRTSIRSIATSTNPFIWYPEPGDVPADIFLCTMAPGSWKEAYESSTKSNGYRIDFTVQEIGGC